MTSTHRLSPDRVDELSHLAAEALRRGDLLVLPTETIYKLVGRADDPAVTQRLHDAKRRQSTKPFSRLVASLDTPIREGYTVTRSARRLAQRFWPGPLTLVLEHPDGHTTGFRVPGHPFVRDVIERAAVPLWTTSANHAGTPDPSQLAAALDALGDHVSLAIDDGPTSLGQASTVAFCPAQGPVEVLHEGFLDAGAIERTLARLIVFVCTGNTCRSPMAEVLFRDLLTRRLGLTPQQLDDDGWRIASAGVAAGPGGPAADHAQTVARERGLDLSRHRSQPLTSELARDAEQIVALSEGHLHAIASRLPQVLDRVVLLDPQGVPDPIGGSLEVYRATADHILARQELLLDALLAQDEGDDDPPEGPGPGGVRSGGPPAAPDWARLPDVIPQDVAPPEVDGSAYLIAGTLRRWSGPTTPVLAPFEDRLVLGHAAELSAEVALEALDAARSAYRFGRGAWPQTSPADRVRALRALGDALRPHREEVARLILWEVGKPLGAARREFDRTLEFLDATLDDYEDLERNSHAVRNEGGVLAQVHRAPRGVALCMGPYNNPVYETFTTLIPALAVGNTAVVKLPRHGALASLPLLPALAEHLPPGVVNVIHGDGAVLASPLMASGDVDVLAFVGSGRVARYLESLHPRPHRLTSLLGMDANNPAVILPDADLDLAARDVVAGAFALNGQRCTAIKLVLAHGEIAEEFAEAVAARADALRRGPMWAPDVVITPMPDPQAAARLADLLADARAHGARLCTRAPVREAGHAVEPSVVFPVDPRARLFQEEQFGPALPITPFDDMDQALGWLERSDYGQQASLFGRDPETLAPWLDALGHLVARVNLNRRCERGPDRLPFAGRGASARGVLSIREALLELSYPAVVVTGDTPSDRELLHELLRSERSTLLRRGA